MRYLNFYLVKTINPTLKAKILFYIAILYSFAILILSLISLQNIEIIKVKSSDKIYHTVCYAIMMVIWSVYLKFRFKKQIVKKYLILAVSIISYGIVIEYLQSNLTNYREFDWWDVLANFIGVITAFGAIKFYEILFNNKKV